MEIKIIKTEKEYDAVCLRIYNLINSTEILIEPDSPEGEELELLSILTEKYEREVGIQISVTPRDAIIFRMEQMNLKQVDLAPLFGSVSRVSEILNGKRKLTLRMIKLLHNYLGIPFESLISTNENLLEHEKMEKIRSIGSIRKFLNETKASVI